MASQSPQASHSQTNNSAIGSWAGYIYQGLVGIYHSLHLMHKQGNKCVGYKLSLDSYEDFSIFDSTGKIESLHQCKCYGRAVNMAAEFSKMQTKLQIHTNSGLCNAGCKLFIHTNFDANCPKDIMQYMYHDNTNKCKPSEIYMKIESLIRLMQQSDGKILLPKLAAARCAKLIEDFVLQLQSDYHTRFSSDPNAKLWVMAKQYFISFTDIQGCLYDNGKVAVFDTESRTVYLKNVYVAGLWDYLMALENIGKNVDYNRANDIMYALETMPIKEATDFFERINPDVFVQEDLQTIINLGPSTKAYTLFKILMGVTPSPSPKINWKEKGVFETPSTIKAIDDEDLLECCTRILKNAPNNSALRQYDWLIAYTNASRIDNIYDTVVNITEEKPDPNSIFAKKKIGILSINDMNNGNY